MDSCSNRAAGTIRLTIALGGAIAMIQSNSQSDRLRKTVLLIFVIGPLVATIAGIVMIWGKVMWGYQLVGWRDMAILAITYTCTGLGITIGYHRMVTHLSFEPHPIVKFIFLAFGSMALEGGAITWASAHLRHHAFSDEDGDPHSPLEGFFHSHFGWMLGGVTQHGKDYQTGLRKDKMFVFFENTFPIWAVLTFVIPYLMGGWRGLFWGGLVRICLCHHVTWSVNSVCHTFGKKMFKTNDQSHNEWIVGLLAFGEGWHNNHHAFPRSAFHGMRWWQVDISSYIIMTLEKIGLVKNVWRVPPERFAAKLK